MLTILPLEDGDHMLALALDDVAVAQARNPERLVRKSSDYAPPAYLHDVDPHALAPPVTHLEDELRAHTRPDSSLFVLGGDLESLGEPALAFYS